MSIVIRSSDVEQLGRELVRQAPDTITLVSGTGAFLAPISWLQELASAPDAQERLRDVIDALAEEEADIDDEDADMVSLGREHTGVDNTIFVSTKGYVKSRHGPRIKIAIDPPDAFVPGGKEAVMMINDYAIKGEHVSPRIVAQAVRFIERNRTALLDYWEGKTLTPQFINQLLPPD